MNEQNAAIKPYVIGLDLGGTNSVFGIVDARGEVEDYVDACVEALQVIIDQVGGIEKIKAMGIGAPNGNYYHGTIEFAPNLAWAKNGVVPLAKMFSERLNNIPVALTNDANAAAIGEMVYGVARGMKQWYAVRKVVYAVADAQVVWSATALLLVWLVRHVKCLQRQTVQVCSVSWILRRSPLLTYQLLQVRATNWPRRFMSSLARCWVRPVPTSQPSLHLRHSSSSEVW